MPLIYIGRSRGFASKTYTDIYPTPFLRGLIEDDQLDLIRSPITQCLIEKDLLLFNNNIPKPESEALDMAIHRVTQMFRLPTPVKMVHLNDVFNKDLDIWNKSAGLPWKEYGINTKGQIRDDEERIREVRHFWHEVKRGKDLQFPDCCAYTRAHLCKPGEHKVRAVWGYPATITFGEAVFALPLIEGYKGLFNQFKPIAYGFETFNGGAKKVRMRFASPTGKYVALDFKSFDKTVPAWMIRTAFEILKLNIDFVNYETRGVADARNMYRMFNRIRDYFINTKIRMASGRRFRKTSGIASGSYFTQLVGSICNAIALYYIAFKYYRYPPYDSLFLGDDSIMRCSDEWNMTDIIEGARDLGLIINTEKSQITESIDEIRFLGYQINHGIAKKEENEFFAALMLPETPDKTWDDVASRALGLYYANMGVNERFGRVAKRIVAYKKFDLCLGRNFGRMLKSIGVDPTELDQIRLPTPLEFCKRLMAVT